MKNSQLKYNKLLQRIRRVGKKELFYQTIADVVQFAMIFSVMLCIILVIQVFGDLSISGRYILLLSVVLLFLLLSIYFGNRLIKRIQSMNVYRLSDRIGEKFPHIKDRLKNALEVYRYYEKNNENYSLELVDNSLERVHYQTRNINFKKLINFKEIKFSFLKSTLIIIAITLVSLIFMDEFGSAAYSILNPQHINKESIDYSLEVTPGHTEVIKHSNVEIKLVITETPPSGVKLHTQNIINGQGTDLFIPQEKDGSYRYMITGIRDSTTYYFYSDEFETDTYLISVIEYPMVRNLQLKVTYPDYTRISPQLMDENIGDIEALRGSKVKTNIKANKNLKRSSIVFDSGYVVDLNVLGHKANGSWPLRKNDAYVIRLEDLNGNVNADPIKYRVKVIEDEYPRVKIKHPGKDVDITEDMQLKVVSEIFDDYGISDVRLLYRKIQSAFQADDTSHQQLLSFDKRNSKEMELEYDWDLSELNLFPEDVISYYIEVYDNDQVSGPKSTKSLTYRVRFPSTEEIFSEVEKGYDSTVESLGDLYEKSTNIKEKLDKIVQAMKKDPDLDWEEKKELEDVTEEQLKIQKSLENLESNIKDIVDKMQRHDLISMETLQKFEELNNLMNEIMTDDMKETLKKLHERFENVDPEKLREAVENLSINQDELIKKLERNIEIMKRLQIERKLDELLKKSEELLKDQMDLMKKAEKSSSSEGEMLSKREEDIKKRTEELKKGLADLEKKMEEYPDMPSENINNALEHIDKSQMMDKMQKASQNFMNGDMRGGMKQSEMAENELSKLNAMLQSAKQQLLESQMQQVMSGLGELSRDLLEVSMKQEDVLIESRGLGRASPSVPVVADKQQDLISGLRRTIKKTDELSQKTFFMSSSIGNFIGLGLMSMEQSIDQFENRNINAANKYQKQSMLSLNEAVKEIRRSMNKLNSSSSASGLEQMLQKLQQMSCQQQGVNQSTLKLGMGGNALSMAQQAAMARLGAEQAAIKKTLQQLQQEYGNRSDILGRLDRLANEMDEIVNDLNANRITRKTIQRQREILSRLLDAQKSVRRREFSKKRKAETATDYNVIDPLVMPNDLGERDNKMRRDLMNLQNEGYERDFEELIMKYFEEIFRNEEVD